MKIIYFAIGAPSFDKNNYNISHMVSRSAIIFQAEKAARGTNYLLISLTKCRASCVILFKLYILKYKFHSFLHVHFVITEYRVRRNFLSVYFNSIISTRVGTDV